MSILGVGVGVRVGFGVLVGIGVVVITIYTKWVGDAEVGKLFLEIFVLYRIFCDRFEANNNRRIIPKDTVN